MGTTTNLVIAGIMIMLTTFLFFYIRFQLKRKRLLKHPYSQKLLEQGICLKEVLLLIKFRREYGGDLVTFYLNRPHLNKVRWMIQEYESFRGKLGETARIKLDKLFSAFLSRNIQDFALKTSKLYTNTSDILEVWEEALWLDIDSSSSELLKVVYDNFFEQMQPHIKKSSDYFVFWDRLCRTTAFTMNSQLAGWKGKIIKEERYQVLLEAELNAFQEKGEITPELIEYLHLPHPDESRYQIQLALDDIAFKELKKKFNLNGNISDLQAGPVIELVQAYNRFTKMLLNY